MIAFFTWTNQLLSCGFLSLTTFIIKFLYQYAHSFSLLSSFWYCPLFIFPWNSNFFSDLVGFSAYFLSTFMSGTSTTSFLFASHTSSLQQTICYDIIGHICGCCDKWCVCVCVCVCAVSYTHLDVYKRQIHWNGRYQET